MGIIKNNLSGKKIGRLKVVKISYKLRSTYWECQCDCGNKIVVKRSNLISGNTKSCGCLKKEVDSLKHLREKSPNWKGDKVKYRALHTRMYKIIPNRNVCKLCQNKCKTELANISQQYKITKDDWMWLCTRCHKKYDNNWEKINDAWYKKCKMCKTSLKVDKNNFYFFSQGYFDSICKKCSSIKCRKYRQNRLK